MKENMSYLFHDIRSCLKVSRLIILAQIDD